MALQHQPSNVVGGAIGRNELTLCIVVACLVVCLVLIVEGHEVPGTIIGGPTLAKIISVIFKGRN